ncbi:MAG TPA: hydroxyacylglutathione hydrolase family protein [Vicinamibacterales bacterium]|jgi:glyoxylase-like metal-dependent hydrolase (beta-lactamase superfamily II)|nr:hydroxyacylglutathione hydrolase family protein [Vicinamibacterales bacterium]
MTLVFEQIRAGGDRNFGYLLGDRDAGVCALIDPSYSPDAFVERARQQGMTVTLVINTHGHPDHVNGNEQAVALTGAKVAAHPRSPASPDVAVGDGQELAIGSLRLRCLHVPGHAIDHLALFEPTYKLLITGDLLFVGKVGGTPNDADARTEWDSLQKLLHAVPDDATVWPGHDYGARPASTVALEKATNPFLLAANADEFLTRKAAWPAFKKQLGLR